MTLPLASVLLGFTEFAPLIGKWIGGDKGADVGQDILGIIHRITGTEDLAMAQQILRENAEALIEFQREIVTLDARLEISLLQDRASARARDASLQIHQGGNARADIMVVSAALGLILCLGTLITYADELPGEAVGIISTIAGIFGSCLKDAYAFEFGSSRGSREKDLAMMTTLERKMMS